jgi:hypothetical protein
VTVGESAAQPLPRQLIAGLVMLGFGAVFGVLGMFLLPHAPTISIAFIAFGGIAGVTGAVLVMKFAGDARFDPPPPPNHPDA